MLSVFVHNGTSLERRSVESGDPPPSKAVWIDMVMPSLPEGKLVEQILGVAVPSHEEMQEIEVSSRLYVENGARYMTATLMCRSDTASPKTTPVTFILAGHCLVTVRYDDPRPFTIIENKLARSAPANITGEAIFVDLLDAVIDRSADILERIGAEVDQISLAIFEPDETEAPEYDVILKQLGRKGDLTSKVRESLVSIGRLLLFLANEADTMRWAKDTRAQLKSMQRDVGSLSDHATYITNKVTFLLDALLGSVSIKQNDIIKIFSIAAVVFMPPTLVASIYGMNFHHGMIELGWNYGYPFALILMVLAAVVPYLIFKWRKWI
jgi:magnesium transporter